ncbi:MAG: succinylglutamate-semialdehyde dehydrogenase [Sphingomonadaceae bacterium]|nr:succinylglutamate-semialdehyde dehydrogenase [Sphingomonadaceae bacterium]
MSRSELISTDPATGDEVWRGPVGDAAAAVAAARAAWSGWARRPLAERVAVARRYRDLVRAREDDFARLIARETGKPLWESRTEVASVAAKVDISVTAQAERAGERQGEVPGGAQAVRHKPHGVLAVLGPYNFPAHLPNGHIVPALLAGNTVVFKPSEHAPATAEFMAALWAEAGLPQGVLTLVQGAGEEGRALAAHPDLDGLLFTGSQPTGHALARQFADRPHTLLALEMGGNNPLVIWDSEPEAAAALIVHSSFITAGQRCSCARRIIMRDGAERPLLAALTGLIDRLIVGAPFDEPQPFMGPVISNAAADRLEHGYRALLSLGGRPLRPLIRLRPDRPFLSPALVDVTGLSVPDEELFGPVAQLIRVPSFDAAIAAANDTRFGLTAGLIGGDRALYDRFWAEARAGVINWNRPTTGAASSAPFGGIGFSGNLRPSAYYAADYAAFPVASIEAVTPAAPPITGLRA